MKIRSALLVLLYLNLAYTVVAAAEAGNGETTVLHHLLKTGEWEFDCDPTYQLHFFSKQPLPTDSEYESVKLRGSLPCDTDQNAWHLLGGLFTDDFKLNQGLPWLGFEFKYNPYETNGLTNLKKFFQSKIFNPGGKLRDKVIIEKHHDDLGRLDSYRVTIKDTDTAGATDTMQQILNRIQRKMGQAYTETLCPLTKLACQFKSLKFSNTRDQDSRYGSSM